MSGSSTLKTRIAVSASRAALLAASAALIALTLSGCSLMADKPQVATTAPSGPRPASAAEAMQRATAAKQQRQAESSATAYVDPLVSARPSKNQTSGQNQAPAENGQAQNVSDFRASGRSATAAMRAESTPSARPAQAARATAPSAVPELTESDLAGVVSQPTGIQAGHNSIFAAANAPAADITKAGQAASAPRISSATGSLSTDAVAYAPVRRISGTTGGLFAGGPQMASNSDVGSATSPPAAANHAPPGIATRPAASAAAEPVMQGLW